MSTETEFLHGPEHVRQYIDTDGEEGYHWRRGTTVLLLTTTGRKSGTPRIHALIFREIDGNPVIVASKGGHPQHPAWFVNLDADPHVQVQIKGDVFDAKARVAEGEERERLWDAMVEVWPDYENYQTRTDRQIPVVVLERQ